MHNYNKPASIIPLNDEERLKKLYRYDILDTPPEEAFDKIAKLAAQIFDTPDAFVSFVDKDRVFFKSNISSLEGNEVLRQDSLCSLSILATELTIFNDTHQIPDLKESPHVKAEGGIRFYAGAPLKTPEGYHLGTVCVTDSKPREASPQQLQMLETLSSIVIDELEQRLSAKKAIRAQTDLMNMAVHELKNPALNISLLADLLIRKSNEEPVKDMSTKIKACIGDITERLEGLLQLSQIEEGTFELNIEEASLWEILHAVKNNFDLLARQKKQSILIKGDESLRLKVDRARIQELFENLLSNALKYSYPDTEITILVRKETNTAIVEFRDQGQGLNEKDLKKLFTKFAKLSSKPTGKERSSGLGLSIVKTLAELHNGQVWASSEGKNKGASFFVSLPL
jgi:signal transduction histidine kinase